MVKQIKDLTIEEIINYCDKRNGCMNCPLDALCDLMAEGGLLHIQNSVKLDKEIDLSKDLKQEDHKE